MKVERGLFWKRKGREKERKTRESKSGVNMFKVIIYTYKNIIDPKENNTQ
jgi:hypothetical protein